MFLPDAFDTELMKRTFMEIVEGKMVKIPVYDFKTSSRYIYRYIGYSNSG
jgi:uridine kinase